MSTLAETLRQLASQFERLVGGSSGENSLIGTMLSGGLNAGGAGNDSSLPGALGQVARSAASGPLGLVASAISSLFRDEPEPVVFPVYERPESLSRDFDIRAAEASRTTAASNTVAAPPVLGAEVERRTEQAGATVLIQVNAMDASSFSDRRNEIASAVREALTRNHSLRDEIWED